MLIRFRNVVAVSISSLALALATVAQQLAVSMPPETHAPVVVHTDHGPNSAQAIKQHYVVLVSLDAFRWDYAKKYGAPHLLAIGKQGVWAPQGMIPSYPSLTFPNHYAIVTGLYPEHNGLVANSFYDESRATDGKLARYAINDPKAVTDGTWYSGVPLWSLAEQQGMRSACLFWPGSEAKIAGELPTDYLHFDDKVDESARIDQVLAWLKQPEETRPHFITLYYSDVDHAGHQYGPDSPETKAAVAKVDSLIGKLHAALDATGLPIDLAVVSDHGMAKTEGPWITLDQFADLTGFETVGPLLYGKTEADRVRVYNQLKKASDKFQVYRLKDVPAGLHYRNNPREGDPVIVPTGPYAIRAHAPDAGKPDSPPIAGQHGYDPHTMPEMKASFFAVGPDIVHGKTVAPFENVNLYPWIAHILGLNPPKSDGDLNILAGTLRDNGNNPVQ
ncbi:alkaline phosphatase family protein [Acidicapsa acidisoli]|uniref:alkaline phosphatase family protein n=1 Tax=Acidicapsa acidisoli TaxID=1615681 RepID=UPI0021E01617|nr:ectonucleotide pyrophosphatase/phosphodiesterase [Acidicapsa acidisoli]